MDSRREEMLREMGLAPLWRLRGSVVSPAVDATSRAETGALETVATPPHASAAAGETPVLQAPAPAVQEDARRAEIMRM
ncbi:MAG TPA: hypothetical protein VGP15_13200, partial [Burkholderiales bacterium]|nr:hypothetical protein [Burkholderiales bacterium]